MYYSRKLIMIKIEITDAPWLSKLVKVTNTNLESPVDELRTVLLKLEQDNTLRTIHIHVDKSLLVRVYPVIQEYNYVFRAYDNNAYQYYKWLFADVEDKVHPFATSTSGATTMILSPDEQSILLVYEQDMWKPVTGADHFKELSLNTALREAEEEVGIQRDLSFEPKVIGFWNIGGRCGGRINNVMTCYIIKALTTELKLDEFEVTLAKWFKIDELKEPMKLAKNKENVLGKQIFWSYVTDQNREKFGYPYMLWLDNYLSGRWFNNHVDSTETNVNFIY